MTSEHGKPEASQEPAMSSQTVQCPVCDREDFDLSPQIQANYQGCAGLNPAAYQECLGVLEAVVSGQLPSQEVYVRAKEALARATEGQP